MIELILKTILEGLGLGALLILVCVAGICNGPVNLVHLYGPEVRERCISLGLTTRKKIKCRSLLFKVICIPVYIAYILLCVYVINDAKSFISGFCQLFVILLIMNLIDRFFIDEFWVGHTKAWVIPGTEDLMPYIHSDEKCKKWLSGTLGMAAVAATLAGIMTLFF